MAKMFVEMTVVEKFAAVAEVLEDAEMRAWIMDRAEKAARKSTSPRKPKPEVEERRAAVATFLNEQSEPVTASMVAEALDMTPRQASAALTALVKAEVAEAFEGEKAKAPKTYAIVR